MNHLRRKIIELAYKAKEGHIASSLSILDVLYVLYHDVLDIDSIFDMEHDRPRVILSKGHGALGLYVVLNEAGLIPDEELETYCQFNSPLGGHPRRDPGLGIEASTGSLGHGLPMAVGVALGYKLRGYGSKVYCIIGDGESNEGSIWESVLLAVHHKLNNLVIIVDYNHSNDRALKYNSLWRQLAYFGLWVDEMDGHNHNWIERVLRPPDTDGRPICLIANTIKGHGVKRMEEAPHAWHHTIPNETEYKEIMEELQCVSV